MILIKIMARFYVYMYDFLRLIYEYLLCGERRNEKKSQIFMCLVFHGFEKSDVHKKVMWKF
jgi:hypothetical protein